MRSTRSVVALSCTAALMACQTVAVGGAAAPPAPIAQRTAPSVSPAASTARGTATVAGASFAGRADAAQVGIVRARANRVEGTQSFAPASTKTIIIIAVVAAAVVIAVLLASGEGDGY